MMIDNKKIQDISLDNFTKFSHAKFEFTTGINVFIGKNGTGKTHLLKILSAILRISKDASTKSNSPDKNLLKTFNIESLDPLVRNFSQGADFTINYHIFEDSKDYFLQYIGKEKLEIRVPVNQDIETFYFPTSEMISSFMQYIPIYEKFDLKWDESLYTLAKALMFPRLKERTSFQEKILPLLYNELEGELIKDESNRFYIKNESGKIEAVMLAEGMKKLASLSYLIENGTITSNTILFWDEPEVYLNPKLITVLSKIFHAMAKEGVQIFLATHDYLLSHQLSLMDEYKGSIAEENVPMKFFCLEESGKDGVVVHSGSNLTHIQNNPILEEFANHYDRERELFERSLKNA
jgi:AAA15 family ATPase/GTPase